MSKLNNMNCKLRLCCSIISIYTFEKIQDYMKINNYQLSTVSILFPIFATR